MHTTRLLPKDEEANTLLLLPLADENLIKTLSHFVFPGLCHHILVVSAEALKSLRCDYTIGTGGRCLDHTDPSPFMT